MGDRRAAEEIAQDAFVQLLRHWSKVSRYECPDLLQNYRDTVLAMHECRVLAGGDPRRWNRLVDMMQAFHLELRETSEGRGGITSLSGDECATVRQWSATNALAWAPREARAELTREVDERGPGAFEAQVTLREFDAGRLNTAWKPKT